MQNNEDELDFEFFNVVGVYSSDLPVEDIERIMENFDEINFDVFGFFDSCRDHSFAYFIYKIFQRYEFFRKYFISIETCYEFS
jgi:hypothetical protein